MSMKFPSAVRLPSIVVDALNLTQGAARTVAGAELLIAEARSELIAVSWGRRGISQFEAYNLAPARGFDEDIPPTPAA